MPACVRAQFSLAYAMRAAMQREELYRYLDGLLEVSRFPDYCSNGLQVEARAKISEQRAHLGRRPGVKRGFIDIQKSALKPVSGLLGPG